ncbi:hypothetical protein Bca52824_054016 [Brassica carinata]|uniref:DUF4283 domain-containing protein n=2 Tax=Brassica carinata TaxID=52824 RepID=A0A8X7UMB3_BRACI|nr:hypothetical protein Bca52824_054016 [Brassica carinata]
MGSSYRSKSTHMANIKGKGILCEDDDEPIKLTDHDVSQNINEFKLSLIGKILNPKKQSERITANDLGNGKFLLNFTTEDELNSVLRQGPFHFNFCMFVLVRWEPIVHDDYPWIIPFWTRLIGVPLHLWTENNLREIGSVRACSSDTIELIEGRMLLDIDSRRPLKFARKAESPEGDEVTIEIKYEMLFKHCSTCGILIHEKEYCPLLQRQGVFARVQLQENRPQQYSKALVKKEPNALHSNAPVTPYHKPSSYATERNNNGRRNYDLDHPREAYKGCVDRVIRRRDDPSWRKRYGGARVEAKPYDRYNGESWREKKSQPQSHHDENVVHDRLVRASMDRGDGSYDHQMRSVSPLPRESAKRVQADREASPLQSQPRPSPDQRSLGVATVTRRIASAIVTPSRGDSLDENVIKRLKGTPRSLAFETLTEQDPKLTTEDDQVIEALNDMDITEQLDGGLMDCEMENDDLMGLELAEMEDKNGHDRADHVADQKSQKLAGRSSRHIKHGYKSRSPQKRSSSSLAARVSGGTGGSRRHHHSSRRQKTGSSKSDGSMGQSLMKIKIYMTFVYGDPILERRDQVWERLTRFSTTKNGPWFMIGDFNEITCHNEKRGGRQAYDIILEGWKSPDLPPNATIMEHISSCRRTLSEWGKQNNVNSAKLVEELKEKVEGLHADDNATTEEIAAALKEISDPLKAEEMITSRISLVSFHFYSMHGSAR